MSRFFAGLEPLLWSKFSVLIFGVIFIGLSCWIYLPSRRSLYEKIARFPLDDGE